MKFRVSQGRDCGESDRGYDDVDTSTRIKHVGVG